MCCTYISENYKVNVAYMQFHGVHFDFHGSWWLTLQILYRKYNARYLGETFTSIPSTPVRNAELSTKPYLQSKSFSEMYPLYRQRNVSSSLCQKSFVEALEAFHSHLTTPSTEIQLSLPDFDLILFGWTLPSTLKYIRNVPTKFNVDDVLRSFLCYFRKTCPREQIIQFLSALLTSSILTLIEEDYSKDNPSLHHPLILFLFHEALSTLYQQLQPEERNWNSVFKETISIDLQAYFPAEFIQEITEFVQRNVI